MTGGGSGATASGPLVYVGIGLSILASMIVSFRFVSRWEFFRDIMI